MRALSYLTKAGSVLKLHLRGQMRRVWGRSGRDVVHLVLGADTARPEPARLRQARLLTIEVGASAAAADAGSVLPWIASMPRLQQVRLQTTALSADGAESVARVVGLLRQHGHRASVRLVLDHAFEGVQAGGDERESWRRLQDTVEALRRHGIDFGVTFTLTPENCYWADDVFLWCERYGVTDVHYAARSFLDHPPDSRGATGLSPERRFHTCMFFDRLPREKKLPLAKRLYYRRVADRIELGPAGPVVPPPDGADGEVAPTTGDLLRLGRRMLAAKAGRLVRTEPRQPSFDVTPRPVAVAAPSKWRHVLITGWYGTETHGDKAILGELLDFIYRHSPHCRITLSTIYSKISSQTALELDGLEHVRMLDIDRCSDPGVIETVDAVIFGGGPLMESAEMLNVWKIFAEANRQQKARVLFGCGVGPIHSEPVRLQTASILSMTSAGFLRDAESHAFASRLCPDHVLHYACDPAVAFVHRWRERRMPVAPGNALPVVALLRANTPEFKSVASPVDIERANADAAKQIASGLERVCAARNTTVDLLHMNAHWVGGDDRIFNRRVADFFEAPARVSVVRDYLPLERHLEVLSQAGVAVAMRYHGHIFCMALGIPFLSIDYTGRAGKVASLVRRIGYDAWSEEWKQVDTNRASTRLQRLMDERDHWSDYLLARTGELVQQLDQTYAAVFGYAEQTTAVAAASGSPDQKVNQNQ